MMWDMMAPMWWMGLLWFLFMVLVFAGIVLVVRAVTQRSGSNQTQSSQDHKTAIHILQERFARGEIDENEYQKRRRVLETRDSDITEA